MEAKLAAGSTAPSADRSSQQGASADSPVAQTDGSAGDSRLQEALAQRVKDVEAREVAVYDREAKFRVAKDQELRDREAKDKAAKDKAGLEQQALQSKVGGCTWEVALCISANVCSVLWL